MTRDRNDTPPDRRTVSKNGRDGAQDRAIAELREKNSDEHDEIKGIIHTREVEFVRAIEAVEGEIKADRRAVYVGWTVSGVFAIAAVGLLGLLLDAHLGRLQEVAESVEATAEIAAEAAEKINAWIPTATRWGNELEEHDRRIEAQSKELDSKQNKRIDALEARLRVVERRVGRGE